MAQRSHSGTSRFSHREKAGDGMARLSKAAIKKSLLDQLDAQGKDTEYNRDLVEIYMTCLDSVRNCNRQIKAEGEIIESTNTKGFAIKKEHPALRVKERQLQRMTDIIRTLDLQNPIRQRTDEDYM
jgi:phage terminase small subunit